MLSESMAFKGFISYSHGADGKLAPAVQYALHRIAKPWYRLRTMRIFRDQTNLSASPGLWSSIESALSASEFFLFMASPGAAQSHWVQKEVAWWLTHRSAQTFLIILTEGEIVWDEGKGEFDWTVTTALPTQLSKGFTEEPLYTDLRWARTVDQLSVRHSQFRGAILEVASTLLKRPKDELDGDDVRFISENEATCMVCSRCSGRLVRGRLNCSLPCHAAEKSRCPAARRSMQITGRSAGAERFCQSWLGLLLSERIC